MSKYSANWSRTSLQSQCLDVLAWSKRLAYFATDGGSLTHACDHMVCAANSSLSCNVIRMMRGKGASQGGSKLSTGEDVEMRSVTCPTLQFRIKGVTARIDHY